MLDLVAESKPKIAYCLYSFDKEYHHWIALLWTYSNARRSTSVIIQCTKPKLYTDTAFDDEDDDSDVYDDNDRVNVINRN